MEKNTPITVPALTCLATALLLSAALLGGCGLPADNAADPVIDAGMASDAQSQDGRPCRARNAKWRADR